MRVLKVKAGMKKRTKLGLELEESAKEILSHIKGEKKLVTRRVALPIDMDVMRIREEARMSQADEGNKSTK